MNAERLFKIVMAVAVVSVLSTGVALAGGAQKRQQSGKSNGTVTRTNTGTATQTRDRLKDGSCLTVGATATPTRTRDRLKDGSCLTK
jgi:hypothetical protein